mmetsp:Transcript_17412/g.41636  ORF Transcript_17412/g.41636 Transcript_17412/m.41636 type:complete len:324 (+) Transcript_17412:861-1832(+)
MRRSSPPRKRAASFWHPMPSMSRGRMTTSSAPATTRRRPLTHGRPRTGRRLATGRRPRTHFHRFPIHRRPPLPDRLPHRSLGRHLHPRRCLPPGSRRRRRPHRRNRRHRTRRLPSHFLRRRPRRSNRRPRLLSLCRHQHQDRSSQTKRKKRKGQATTTTQPSSQGLQLGALSSSRLWCWLQSISCAAGGSPSPLSRGRSMLATKTTASLCSRGSTRRGRAPGLQAAAPPRGSGQSCIALETAPSARLRAAAAAPPLARPLPATLWGLWDPAPRPRPISRNCLGRKRTEEKSHAGEPRTPSAPGGRGRPTRIPPPNGLNGVPAG